MDIAAVRSSMGRAQRQGALFDRFYEIFLTSHVSIGPMFTNTDFAKQKELLRQGLNLTIMFADGNQIGQNGVDRIRRSHSRSNLNIQPSLYPHWKNSFMQAVRECDPDFNPALEQSWSEVLQLAIDHIAAGYDAPADAIAGA